MTGQEKGAIIKKRLVASLVKKGFHQFGSTEEDFSTSFSHRFPW
jgi:hypothetical protein